MLACLEQKKGPVWKPDRGELAGGRVSPRDQVAVGVVVEGEDEVRGGHGGSHPVYTGYNGGEGEHGACQGVEDSSCVRVLSVREDEEAVGGRHEDMVAEHRDAAAEEAGAGTDVEEETYVVVGVDLGLLVEHDPVPRAKAEVSAVFTWVGHGYTPGVADSAHVHVVVDLARREKAIADATDEVWRQR